MAIEKNIVIGADLSGLERKLEELIDLLKDSQKAADKTADSVENIAEEVGEVGDSAKDAKKGIDGLSKGFKGLGLSIKAAGIGLLIEGFQLFKDVLSSNQGVADTFAVALQTLIFAFNGIINAVSSGNFASIPSILASSVEEARKFVDLQKKVEVADAKRNKLQLENQILAERQRQIRDNEMLTIKDRIAANEELSRILVSQLLDEKELVDLKVQQAEKMYELNDNNENYLALLEAQTEQIDIQERIEGQMSEFQMNRNALRREQADLERTILEQAQEQIRIETEGDIALMNNKRKALQEEWYLETGLANAKIIALDKEIKKLKEGTLEYQEAYGERMALEKEMQAFMKRNIAERAQLRRDSIQENFDLTSQGFDALMQLNEAFAEDDEASAKRAFERNKKLQTAQAVVNTAQAVTAQLAVPQDALTGANFVKAGIALATGIAQIRTIQATQFEGGTGSLDTSVSEPQAPSFNIVGSTGANAILESLQNNPVRAYVVGSDVTSQQELDRNRINQVSFP